MRVKGLVFIGSRANFGRLITVLKEMQKNEDWLDFKIFLASSGTYIDLGGFETYVDYKVDGLMYKDTPANMGVTTSIVMDHASNYLSNSKYDFCLIHGDRYECLGMAQACFFNGVHILHTEGGEWSGGFDNKVRYIISEIASIHFATTRLAYERLAFVHSNVYQVGSPTVDYVYIVLERRKPPTLNPYMVVLYNPLLGEAYMDLIRVIKTLSTGIDIIWVNPNVDPGSKDLIYKLKANGIKFIKDVKPDEYIKLLDGAHLLLGNTSSGIKEGAAIGIPYVLVGNRQEGREAASNVYRVPMDYKAIMDECEKFIGFEQTKITYDGTFGNGLASEKILKKIKENYYGN